MTVRFANPPLQELVAEVRWQPISGTVIDPARQDTVQLSAETTGRVEAFYAEFSKLAVRLGYFASERLLPQGLPVPVGNVALRHRRIDEDNILVQAGPGVVTMNALPPYKSWDDLEPRLADLLEPLLHMNQTVREEGSSFSVRVRYINAFGKTFLENLTPGDFIRLKLGFGMKLPSGVKALALAEEIDAFQKCEFAVNDFYKVELVVAPGEVNGDASAILDTTVVSASSVNANHTDIMDALRGARNIAHELFLASIKNIEGSLVPIVEAPRE